MYNTTVSANDYDAHNRKFKYKIDENGNVTSDLATEDLGIRKWWESLATSDQRESATVDDYLAYANAQNISIAREALKSDEYQYVESLIHNAYYGMSGLTELQQNRGLQNIASAAQDGNLLYYLNGRDGSMIDAYLDGVASAPTYLAAAQRLEAEGLTNPDGSTYTIEDFAADDVSSEQYKTAAAVLDNMGISAESALKAVRDFNTEMLTRGVKAATKYGDSTEEVADNMAELRGNARSVAGAYKSLNQVLTSASNNQYYRSQYMSGSRDKDTIAAIASMTGLDEQAVQEHSDYVEQLMDEMYASDLETVQNEVSAFDQYLSSQNFAVELPALQTSGGAVDLSDAISAMTSDAAAQLQSLADALASLGFSAQVVAEGSGENMSYRIVVSDFSGAAGRRSGGGGGGGGGKSATAKLLEEQERE